METKLKYEDALVVADILRVAFSNVIESIKDESLKLHDYLLLTDLLKFDGKSMHELKDYLIRKTKIKKAHVIKVLMAKKLGKFQKMGLIDLPQDVNDRRKHNIIITKKGHEFFNDLNIKLKAEYEILTKERNE